MRSTRVLLGLARLDPPQQVPKARKDTVFRSRPRRHGETSLPENSDRNGAACRTRMIQFLDRHELGREELIMTVGQRFEALLAALMLTADQQNDGATKHAGVRRCLNQHYYGVASDS